MDRPPVVRGQDLLALAPRYRQLQQQAPVSRVCTPAGDTRAFKRPDEFDIERSPNQHLTVGHGAYYCIGVSLARIELQEVFTRLIRGIPTLRLAVPHQQLRVHADRITDELTTLARHLVTPGPATHHV